MTGGNGKPSLDRIARPDWGGSDTGGRNVDPVAVGDQDESFSQEARMAHQLVSLFLSIDDHETRRRCLAFVREQAESSTS